MRNRRPPGRGGTSGGRFVFQKLPTAGFPPQSESAGTGDTATQLPSMNGFQLLLLTIGAIIILALIGGVAPVIVDAIFLLIGVK